MPIPPRTDEYLAPYPGKREILAATDCEIEAALQSATVRIPPVLSTTDRIVSVSKWPVGAYPNYCDAAIVGKRHYVWVASFGDESVTRIDVLTGSSLKLATGSGTLPLDVAYDRNRDRVIVASADDEATMVVLDSAGNTIARKKLVLSTGQGLSDGGAQGVAVDSQGNYWFTLAYHGSEPRGVVVKVDGERLNVSHCIKDAGLNNPNGILYAQSGDYVLVLSDNGVAHQFDVDGVLQRVLKTVGVGYRGVVNGDTLWVAGWLGEGQMASVDLRTGSRQFFPCVPLANSVTTDDKGRIWVAGDAGVSVSDETGTLLAISPFPAYSNGLTSLGGRTYHTAYRDQLNQVIIVSPRVLLPSLLLSQ